MHFCEKFFWCCQWLKFWRLGLLGPSLGLHPTGGLLADMKDGKDEDESESAPLQALLDPFASTQQCCCFNISGFES